MGGATAATFPTPAFAALPDGTVVHASVRAIAASGSWAHAASDGAVVQSVVPAGAAAMVDVDTAVGGGGATGLVQLVGQADATRIAAAWQFEAPLGTRPVALTYRWAVVDAVTRDSVLPFVAVGAATWGVATTTGSNGGVGDAARLLSPLQSGHRYAAVVVATNEAGVNRTIVSSAVVVDATAPALSSVNATRGVAASYPQYTTPAATFQAGTDNMTVVWACHDPDATVTNVSVAVGGVVGGDQVREAGLHAPVGSVTLGGLHLQHAHCYHAAVSCINDAALASRYLTSGPLCVDATAAEAAVDAVHPVVVAARDVNNNASAVVDTVVDMVAQSTAADQDVRLTMSHIRFAAAHLVDGVASAHAAGAVFVSPALLVPASVSIRAADFESGVTRVDLMWSTASGGANGTVYNGTVYNRTAVEEGAVTGRQPVATSHLSLLGVGSVAVGASYADLVAAVPAVPGRPSAATSAVLYPHLRVFNGAGEVTVAGTTGAPLALDATAPRPNDRSPTPWFDVEQFPRSTTTLAVSWDLVDEESVVIGAVWDVVRQDDPDGTAVIPPRWSGLATSARVGGLALVPGVWYVVRLTVCNSALLCSTHVRDFMPDLTAPSPGVVYLGYQDSALVEALCGVGTSAGPCSTPALGVLPADRLSSRHFAWSHFEDRESGVRSLRMALGTSIAGSQLGTPRVRNGGGSGSVRVNWLVGAGARDVEAALVNGAVLYVSVTAENQAGMRTTVSVPLMAADTVPPSVGTVMFAGPPAEPQAAGVTRGIGARHVVVTNSTSDATVTWSAFAAPPAATAPSGRATAGQDAVAGAAVEYTVSIVVGGGGGGGAVVAGPVPAGAALAWTFAGLALQPGQRYTAIVAGTDAAGNVVAAHSAADLVADATPPVQRSTPAGVAHGIVRDGPDTGQDVDCYPRAGSMAASPTLVFTLALDGIAATPVATTAPLPADVGLEGTVCGEGQDGAAVAVVTDEASGLTGLCGGVAAEPSSEATVLRFTAPPFVDGESGVGGAEVALGFAPGASDAMPWTPLPFGVNEWQVVMPVQEEGTLLFASLRAVNGVGVWGEARSDGVRLLCVPGTVGCDYDGTFVCLA